MTEAENGANQGKPPSGARRWLAEVVVTPKPGVNDPEGETIHGGLNALGFHVNEVRAGRFMRLVVDAVDVTEAERSVASMCEQLLANPVIQTYAITIVEASAASSLDSGARR